MSDPGTRAADEAAAELVRRIHKIYGEAYKDLVKRLDSHTRALNAKDEKKRAELAAGKITEGQYKSWLMGQMKTGQRWQDMVLSVTSTMQNAGTIANDMINGEKRAVFAENANYTSYQLEKDTHGAVSFTLYDSATVTRLLRDQPELMPRRVVDGERLDAWNRTIMANTLAQGIIQGAKVEDITKMIAERTSSQNEAANRRYARTAMTSAQNAGRIEMLREATAMGIKVRKVWLATLDDRTREAHANLDGQSQEVEKPFESDLGPIMYPGDPFAEDANVWNCRCTLVYEHPEYKDTNVQRYDQLNRTDIEYKTYNEWKAEKEAKEGKTATKAPEAKPNKPEEQKKPEEPKPRYAPFVPAQTLDEAERFADDSFVDTRRFGAIGVSYQGIGLDVANEVNRTIYAFYNTYRVDKFGGVLVPRGNSREGKLIQGAVAGYSPIRHSFLLNRSCLKSLDSAEKRFKDEREMTTKYLANPGGYVIRNKLAEKVMKASAVSGRATVPTNVQETVWHELGHSLEKALSRVDNYGKIVEGFSTWGEKVSGYATSEMSEYIAESFCAWNKGEKIDPELVKGFEALRR